MSYAEMKKLLEKQLWLLSEQSVNSANYEDGMELAALSEQMVNVGKFLIAITPADEKIPGRSF